MKTQSGEIRLVNGRTFIIEASPHFDFDQGEMADYQEKAMRWRSGEDIPFPPHPRTTVPSGVSYSVSVLGMEGWHPFETFFYKEDKLEDAERRIESLFSSLQTVVKEGSHGF